MRGIIPFDSLEKEVLHALLRLLTSSPRYCFYQTILATPTLIMRTSCGSYNRYRILVLRKLRKSLM